MLFLSCGTGDFASGGIREVLYSEFFRAYANPDAQVFVLTKTENVKRW